MHGHGQKKKKNRTRLDPRIAREVIKNANDRSKFPYIMTFDLKIASSPISAKIF